MKDIFKNSNIQNTQRTQIIIFKKKSNMQGTLKWRKTDYTINFKISGKMKIFKKIKITQIFKMTFSNILKSEKYTNNKKHSLTI